MAHYDLGGRVALVTGASAGLGAQFALGFAASGASVVLAARRSDRLGELAASIEGTYGVVATHRRTDVCSESDIVGVVEHAMDRFGRLDVVVNNAGTLVAKPLVEHSLSDWHQVLDTNLTSAFLMTREAARVMIPAGHGSIINISSIFAFGAVPEFSEVGYYASKGGLEALTRATAVELGPHGIRVNAIAPGFFPTDMGADITEELRARLIEPRTALDSRARNEWIRGAACFLASDDAAFVTGSTLTVDGGWRAC